MYPIPQHLYPFQSNYLKINGLNYHYLDEGEGDPVVMVHGNPSWSFYYRNLVTALNGKFRCIVPDHMGCGLSDKPNDQTYSYTLEQRVNDLDDLLKKLQISSSITLVVHDWGGMIGFAWAVKNASKIKRIVVLNTAAFLIPKGKKLPFTLSIVRNTWLGSFLVRAFNAFSFSATYMAVTKPLARDVSRAYRAPYNNWKNRIATLRFVQNIPMTASDRDYNIVSNTAKNLPSLAHLPMLICWGMKDFVFDHHFLTEWKTHFPNAKVHEYADAGHYILEDESDSVIQRITDFIA